MKHMKHGGIDYVIARDPQKLTKFRFTIYPRLFPGGVPKIVSGAVYNSYDEAAAACRREIDLGLARP